MNNAQADDSRRLDSDAAARAVQALTRAARFLERASNELSPADFRVLSAIADGEARASRLAQRLAIGRPTVSASIDSLVRRGLVIRSVVVDDQRASSLSLTVEGAAVRNRVEVEMIRRLELLCERVHDGTTLIETLTRLGAAIESVMGDAQPSDGVTA